MQGVGMHTLGCRGCIDVSAGCEEETDGGGVIVESGCEMVGMWRVNMNMKQGGGQDESAKGKGGGR